MRADAGLRPTVTTSKGEVRGIRHEGVDRYLGIPYALPPFGERRLALPHDVPAWTEVRDAAEFGPTAPQDPYFGALGALLGSVEIPGDDILTVNVWAPADVASSGAGLPVLVWYHGGALERGTPALPAYDGATFARDGVVFVSIAHRVGAEGFSVLDGAPRNLGLCDAAAGLLWVQREIARFGGDPARITIFGESAGGALVAAPLATRHRGDPRRGDHPVGAARGRRAGARRACHPRPRERPRNRRDARGVRRRVAPRTARRATTPRGRIEPALGHPRLRPRGRPRDTPGLARHRAADRRHPPRHRHEHRRVPAVVHARAARRHQRAEAHPRAPRDRRAPAGGARLPGGVPRGIGGRDPRADRDRSHAARPGGACRRRADGPHLRVRARLAEPRPRPAGRARDRHRLRVRPGRGIRFAGRRRPRRSPRARRTHARRLGARRADRRSRVAAARVGPRGAALRRALARRAVAARRGAGLPPRVNGAGVRGAVRAAATP
ncbi:carboxylesterase family protein [Microbacterium paulum]